MHVHIDIEIVGCTYIPVIITVCEFQFIDLVFSVVDDLRSPVVR